VNKLRNNLKNIELFGDFKKFEVISEPEKPKATASKQEEQKAAKKE